MSKNLKTNQDLYAIAYPLFGDEYCDVIRELQSRNQPEDIEYSVIQSKSDDDVMREIAVDTLSEIGFNRDLSEKELLEVKSAILANLSTDNESLLEATVRAAGNRGIVEAIDFFGKIKNHQNKEVRFAIAFALGICHNASAIRILIDLSTDQDSDVRNWATFALGSQIEDTSDELVDALIQRLNDSDFEVVGEAIVGLARRDHSQIIEILIEKLSDNKMNSLILEACSISKSPKLFEHLKLWVGKFDDEYMKNLLHEAMTDCSK